MTSISYNENLAQKYIKEYLAKRTTGYEEYKYYHPSYWQGYRFVGYSDWTIMLKYLANPEYHPGKQYPCDSLEIKSNYINTLDGGLTIIDFSDFNNNAKQVWEAVRNNGTPSRKKFLDIPSHGQMKINPMTQEEYALNVDKFIARFKKNSKYPIENYNLDKMATAYKEYAYFDINGWIEQKKYQLS
ncbi:hypothetical protein C1646_809230 [Rhizophagus diaphanus]|nr:hypothetical protein C1646_809230 [Rhizophagus diaphanus] [Rhizophagus sp. MUCL 43196]